MQLYLATAENTVCKFMSSNLSWRIAATLGAGLSIVAILVFWLTQSTPPNTVGQSEQEPPKILPLELHDAPRTIPAFTFSDRDTNSVELVTFVNRVVLLNLWATWCAPCIQELPALDRLQQALGSNDFVVIALSLDRGGLTAVDPFWTQMGLTHLDIYLDPTMSAGQTLSTRGLPTTLLINRNGLEIARIEGPAEWDSEQAIAYLQTLVATQ